MRQSYAPCKFCCLNRSEPSLQASLRVVWTASSVLPVILRGAGFLAQREDARITQRAALHQTRAHCCVPSRPSRISTCAARHRARRHNKSENQLPLTSPGARP